MFRLLVQELKFRRSAILSWGLGLCFFPIVYVGIYPSVAEEMAGLADLEIYQLMGVNLGTFGDWVASILMVFLPLIAAIFAIINGTGTLAGEEEDGEHHAPPQLTGGAGEHLRSVGQRRGPCQEWDPRPASVTWATAASTVDGYDTLIR